MFVNWGIEAAKWRFLISRIEVLSFFRAFIAVLSGITVSTLLPNRTGEYLGRVFIFNKANRIQGILITIIGSISQLLITIILGLISIIFMVKPYFTSDLRPQTSDFIYTGIIILNLAIIAICIFLYFNISSLSTFLHKLKIRRLAGFANRLSPYFRVFSYYTFSELFKVLLLSLCRYFVFALQFYLIMKLSGLNLPGLHAAVFICSVFFIMTIVPTIAITDPGIRGSVALTLFTFYFIQNNFVDCSISSVESYKISLVASTLMLWLINLIIPAFIGSFFVLKLKFFKPKQIS
jgi:hypothetical protein